MISLCSFTDDDIKMKLVDGEDYRSGRVEIQLEPQGEWGTVCDDSFDSNDASVICRGINHTFSGYVNKVA